MSRLSDQLSGSLAAVVAHGEPLLLKFGYPGIFVANFTEGIGIPLPGQTLLMVGALLASQGQLQIGLVLGLAFAGSLLGACVGFAIGRRSGRVMLRRLPVNPALLERVEDFFRRRGIVVVLFSRFVDGFRQLTPIVAGSLEMRWWPFFWASVLSSLVWVGVWGLGVYLLDEDFHRLLSRVSFLKPYGWALCLLVLAALGIWLLGRRTPR